MRTLFNTASKATLLIIVVFSCLNFVFAQNTTVSGQVNGIVVGDSAQITLGNDQFLARQVIRGNSFQFRDILPGKYFVKIDLYGYNVNPAKEITILSNGSITGDALRFTVSKMQSVDNSGQFSFSWQEDKSRSGLQQTAYVNKRPEVVFLNETIQVPDLAAAEKLVFSYNIIITNERQSWNQEYAYRLLETMKTIPQNTRNPYADQSLKPSKWVLTNQFVPNDITIEYGPNGNRIIISEAAFTYATPQVVMLDGLRGKFFSQRLHNALVRYVTQEGRDSNAIERIFQERYGCTTRIPNYAELY